MNARHCGLGIYDYAAFMKPEALLRMNATMKAPIEKCCLGPRRLNA